MIPNRLQERPLPEDFARKLLLHSANAKSGSLDNGELREVTSPFISEPLGHVGVGSADDVEKAFELSRRAQKQWQERSIASRARVIKRFHDLVKAHSDLLADIVQLETGKDRTAAYDEVLDVMNNARYYANNAEKFLATKDQAGAFPVITNTTQQRVPKGIVGQISPWNYPLALGVSDAIAALIAGNGCLLYTSPSPRDS